MDLGLKGLRAIVTGGSKGIGRRCADILADEGAHVAICARNPAEVEATVDAMRAKGVIAYGEAVDVADKAALAGAIVLAPPSAIQDRWARRLHEPVTALASGWMRVRQRAKSRGVELPLVISDHADWDELLATLDAVQAPEIWVTHGREEALIHAAALRGISGRALSLVGREEDSGE